MNPNDYAGKNISSAIIRLPETDGWRRPSEPISRMAQHINQTGAECYARLKVGLTPRTDTMDIRVCNEQLDFEGSYLYAFILGLAGACSEAQFGGFELVIHQAWEHPVDSRYRCYEIAARKLICAIDDADLDYFARSQDRDPTFELQIEESSGKVG